MMESRALEVMTVESERSSSSSPGQFNAKSLTSDNNRKRTEGINMFFVFRFFMTWKYISWPSDYKLQISITFAVVLIALRIFKKCLNMHIVHISNSLTVSSEIQHFWNLILDMFIWSDCSVLFSRMGPCSLWNKKICKNYCSIADHLEVPALINAAQDFLEL